jgi:DNA-binding XRE family transcriptional regulator
MIRDAAIPGMRWAVPTQLVITGLKCRRSLYDSPRELHGVHAMTALRELRRAADLSQQELAALIGVPLNTFRMWDSGLRPAPPLALLRSHAAVTAHLRNAA